MNYSVEEASFHRGALAVCVGIGLNIAWLFVTYFLLVFGGVYMATSLPPQWHFPLIILIYYAIPAAGMTFAGFVTAHLTKSDIYIYKTCFVLGVLAPISLFIVIQMVMGITLSSPGYDWLSQYEILGFFLMHIPAMLLGGFLYKTYFKASTKSNRLDNEMLDEYLD